MRRLAWIVLSVLCCVLLAGCEKEPVERTFTEHASGDYEYRLYSDGTAEIARYTGEEEIITVPAELDGHPVTAIGCRAFHGDSYRKEITIPDGVTSIGDEAFAGSCIRKITLPDGLVHIGSGAFRSCHYLAEVFIPDSVASVGTNPFWESLAAGHISLSPEHPVLELIDGVLFDKNEKRLICYPTTFDDTEYTVPDGTRSIGEWAFGWNSDLKKVILPSSLVHIESDAFQMCCNLAEIAFTEGLISIGDRAFDCCFDLAEIALPDGLISIGDRAFDSCFDLEKITIPESVTFIDSNPFSSCTSLTRISVSQEHPTLEIIDGMLFDRTAKRLICCPAGFSYNTLSLPAGTLSIGEDAFVGCAILEFLLPDGVIAIEDGAFSDCWIEKITLPETLTSIGNRAFADSRLHRITIPGSVTSIGDEAFYSCAQLTHVIVPEGVTQIGERAFADCPYLTLFVKPGSYAAQYAEENGIPYSYQQ